MIFESFEVKTEKRNQLLNITDQVEGIIAKNSIKEGVCLVFVPHATAAIMLFENYDPALCDDFINALNKLIPQGQWKHDKIDGNGDAHIKSGIIGASETIPIKNGKLQLGTWQGITLCEFDGPRKRKIHVKVIE